MKSWLIQRAYFIENSEKEGIDSILVFDYMGSSEFEWGALPKALKELRLNISEYIFIDIEINKKIITLFCKSNQQNEIILLIKELSMNEIHLKERSDFARYIYPDSKWGSGQTQTDFWWDIGNHFMFWRKNIGFEIKFKTKIRGQDRTEKL